MDSDDHEGAYVFFGLVLAGLFIMGLALGVEGIAIIPLTVVGMALAYILANVAIVLLGRLAAWYEPRAWWNTRTLCPTACDIIQGRCEREPRCAAGIMHLLGEVMRGRLDTDSGALNWIVPGNPSLVRWRKVQQARGRTALELRVEWPNGLIYDYGELFVPEAILPASVATTLPGRRVDELFDFPFGEEGRVIEQRDLELQLRQDRGAAITIARQSLPWTDMRSILEVHAKTVGFPGLRAKRK